MVEKSNNSFGKKLASAGNFNYYLFLIIIIFIQKIFKIRNV